MSAQQTNSSDWKPLGMNWRQALRPGSFDPSRWLVLVMGMAIGLTVPLGVTYGFVLIAAGIALVLAESAYLMIGNLLRERKRLQAARAYQAERGNLAQS